MSEETDPTEAPQTTGVEASAGQVPETDDSASAPTALDDILAREAEDPTRPGVTVESGEALDSAEAAAIAATNRATVVVLVGVNGSGKTTLLASLFERFGRGPVNGHLFLGSQTLAGFERRCHKGRTRSGEKEVSTPHTQMSDLPWLHLELCREDEMGATRNLLLGDYSGEWFKKFASDSDEVEVLPFLRRADHVCLTLNGRNFARVEGRAAETKRSEELLQALLAPGVLADPAALTVVLTKLDLVTRAGAEAEGAAARAYEALGQAFSSSPGSGLPYIETAARSTITRYPLGHGVDDLLSRWTDSPAVTITHTPPRAREPETPFDRYEA